jgi:hypothetical protein
LNRSILPLCTSQIFNGLFAKESSKTWSRPIIIRPVPYVSHDTRKLPCRLAAPVHPRWWSEMEGVWWLRRSYVVTHLLMRAEGTTRQFSIYGWHFVIHPLVLRPCMFVCRRIKKGENRGYRGKMSS